MSFELLGSIPSLPALLGSARQIALDPMIDELLAQNAPVAIGVSGGKDSQAAALATVRHLDEIGHTGPRILVHSDLGSVEWQDSLPICEELAEHLGIELKVVARKAGGLMQRWERRHELSVQRYLALSTVTLVPCWSTPSMRFCTSELKAHVITAELSRLFGVQTVVNVTGVRRDESAQRSKSTIADIDKKGRLASWRPLADWSAEDVFAEIDASGLRPHPAYRLFGMSRVSCQYCIMSSLPDMIAAAAQEESHDLYREMVSLEGRSSFAFQGSRWLGDVAPHLLGEELAGLFAEGKKNALGRVALEKRITKPMLYEKGWPTRMLTDDEADILAEVRTGMAEIFKFQPLYTDRAGIHQRYEQLIVANQLKKAA